MMKTLILVVSMVVCSIFFLPLHEASADPYRWNTTRIGVKTVHDTEQGEGVKVAVIDGGVIRCSHYEFALSGGCSTYSVGNTYFPYYSNHGTHVATTIAGDKWSGQFYSNEFVGVAPKAEILGYNFLDSEVGASSGTMPLNAEDIFISHAYRAGARVVNMSYGPNEAGELFLSWPNERMYYLMPKYSNMVYVKAAGNNGVNLLPQYYWSTASGASEKPDTDLKNLIIVGAVDRNLNIASFSNRPGNSCFRRWNGSSWATSCKGRDAFKYFFVVAPGVDIVAGGLLGNTYYYSGSGTSMAAPHVTGVVALLQGHWPVLLSRAGSVANIIFHTAQDLGASGVDAVYGWGLVRADRALSPLGKKYLGKNNKVYSLSASRLKVSPALSALTTQSVTFFDGYDRDFQMPLATLAPSYAGVLNTWMRDGYERHEYTLGSNSGLSYAFSANGYDPMNPSLSDVQWRMSFNDPNGMDWHLGQGVATDRLDSTQALSFGLMADKTHQGGAYPVMALADGGLYGFIDQPLALGFNLTGGLLTNNTIDSEADERDFAPKSDAVVVALGRTSTDKRLSGSLSATYLMEDQGVLGTGGAGGLGFTEGSESQAITLSTSYQLSGNTELSASYTEAFSKGDTSTDNLLTLTSSHLASNAFALGVAQRRLISDTDELKFSIGQPLRVDGGSMSLVHDDYYDEAEAMHSRSVDIDLSPTGRQIDYQLQYIFSPKKNLTLGAFAYYANDYLHQNTLTDHGVGVRVMGGF